jgi:hypothetical protein
LLLSIMLVEGSCIVADPPEYRAPGQTRPLLNAYGAVPTATRALVVFSGDNGPTTFTVQVRSEDAGEDLRALFFLDYQLPSEDKLVSQKVSASTYDNPGRNITYPWHPKAKDAGCHFLSLVVAHTNSFLEADDDQLIPAAAEEDASIITWTVNIDPPPGAVNTLSNCPSRAAVAP